MTKQLRRFITIIFIFSIKPSSAQETQTSLLDEVSYVYVEKLIAVAKENYPRLKSHNSKIKIAESAVTSAKVGWLSPLSLSYVYSPANTLNISNPTFFSGYQIGFSFSLGSILQTPSTIKQAKEEYKIAKYDLEEYLLTLSTEVKTRYFNYLSALKGVKISSQASSNAQNLLTMVKYKYEKGEATFEDYNNAVTQYTTNSKSKAESEVALLTAKVALEELLGIRLEEVPQ